MGSVPAGLLGGGLGKGGGADLGKRLSLSPIDDEEEEDMAPGFEFAPRPLSLLTDCGVESVDDGEEPAALLIVGEDDDDATVLEGESLGLEEATALSDDPKETPLFPAPFGGAPLPSIAMGLRSVALGAAGSDTRPEPTNLSTKLAFLSLANLRSSPASLMSTCAPPRRSSSSANAT
jgi:hypothetical protein